VLDHPYFAVTSPGGQFDLEDVPAGTYTIEAWHEKLGTQTQSVTIAENDSKDISFTFKIPETTQP
jgi:Carboxypeptidase regulatory-like domain